MNEIDFKRLSHRINGYEMYFFDSFDFQLNMEDFYLNEEVGIKCNIFGHRK